MLDFLAVLGLFDDGLDYSGDGISIQTFPNAH
jgi:hypothetical protein